MKVSDYIVEFLINKGITDVFGYPGGMVTHLMDSFNKYGDRIHAHLNYHEQASSFSACGYATLEKPGVAYATSGPGATNLITGICNSYYDSIPTIFITGQVNTYECKPTQARQIGFQETDVVSMVKGVTKYAVRVEDPYSLPHHLDLAYKLCLNERPGPVLLDIPMNILRSDIEINRSKSIEITTEKLQKDEYDIIIHELNSAKNPCILVGAGVKVSNMTNTFRGLAEILKIPVVSSMIAVDVMFSDSTYFYGFIGAYGHRAANFIIDKSDLIISLGSRLDYRQTGTDLNLFAPKAKLVRVDIDKGELTNKIKNNETHINADLKDVLPYLVRKCSNEHIQSHCEWNKICQDIKNLLPSDELLTNKYISEISDLIEDDVIITTDVGQNQVWIAQSFKNKCHQKILFSGGHGAMGYSLPAAIGAHFGYRKKIIAFCGDGGFQMNIQELQTIFREKLPIKIVLLNNSSLGMIRHFQEIYFQSKYYQTKEIGGYTVPDFGKIATAYGIRYIRVNSLEDVYKIKEFLYDDLACIIEVVLPEDTFVFPKLKVGKPIHDQEPEIDRTLYQKLMNLI